MDIKQVSLELVMLLRPTEQVNAVVLFGSHAAKRARSDSDVDLLVIVQDGFEQTSKTYKGQLFEITFVTEQATCDWWQSNTDHCVTLWRCAKVLHSKNDTAERLRRFAEAIEEKGKPAMSLEEVAQKHRAASYQLDSLTALATQDPPAANLVLGEKISEYVRDYFDVLGLWTPAPKERPAMIRSHDAQVGSLLDAFAHPTLALDQKLKTARALVDLIFQYDEKSGIH